MRFIVLATIFATAIVAAPVGVNKQQEMPSMASALNVHQPDSSIIPAPCLGSQCQDSHPLRLVRRMMTKEERQAARLAALKDASHHKQLHEELNGHGEKHAVDAEKEGIDKDTRDHHLKSAQDYYSQGERHKSLQRAAEKDAEAYQHHIDGKESDAKTAEEKAQMYREMAVGKPKGTSIA
ncbi:hypothetical protein FRC14_001496 [Serendipita sp. 396]|nr:hypothetical protein FRC14_001496 [Serendipita sp. 396]KAG8785458.1 hypothetical protein FRC15_001319 [Serendipita sp. 397]KAG8800050.1 hypothetical protein FRC16_003823 [Serendipita sp. 398]KAG8815090.1 hypothetical protein FRC18_001645 [Serendipita sp. 400]KAG8826952.1 hypothetical protein FRC19_006576 [Serendipita sp. 401]KAG8869294.1 hypothetical protein FRC20_001732 [Serendipita sp. 405]KAG9057606.1 hypothetical protein FS842_005310 [Serendipita sp. 407]